MSKSPYYLRAILDVYVLPIPRIEEEVNSRCLEELKSDGLIEKNAMGSWLVTRRGEAYIKMLMEVPLPIQIWTSPERTYGN